MDSSERDADRAEDEGAFGVLLLLRLAPVDDAKLPSPAEVADGKDFESEAEVTVAEVVAAAASAAAMAAAFISETLCARSTATAQATLVSGGG